ncbi:hypothetical protein HHK36_019803 [Tetracentron sinense]|uniref:AAA+ ATPase domain-containing protein n=1 Tax=Tetracentron sinense TaxID=13715 RepID=A0A834YUE8_TETSI|nr:hypothetical protein HHK36_019803 [Tetracentron sinense]
MGMEFLVCISEKMCDCLVPHIKRQLGYFFCYNSNIENLRKEVEKLRNTRDEVQGLVDAAERNVEVIRADVRKWLTDTDNIIEKVGIWNENVIVNKRSFNGWCPDCSWRYRISKEAKNNILDIDELQSDRTKFDCVSFPAPPPGIEAISADGFTSFKSTESALDQIMEALKDSNVNIIGLYGVGGVGKTTLVKQVGKRAKENKLFDEVPMAVVSHPPDIKKIQEQIADMLGLKFSETTEFVRAGRLSKRLTNGKRILVILDDLWERLDLETVGIPQGCKIILTTRSQNVCTEMGSQTKICLNALSEEESWAMFKRYAGICVNTPNFNDVAREVAGKCGGLPLALVIVGRALGDKDLDEWKKAARKLKESKPINEQDVDYKVFSCLRLSYDYLKGEETKACFLLCSLFPEDRYISIESLTRYGMGQGLFQDVDTLEEARGKAHTTIKHLKASCLLLDDFDNDFVRMHDVVRHVAKTIASKDKHVLVRPGEAGLKEWPNKGTFEHDTGISLMDNDIVELPLGLECPKLQILLLQNNTNLKEIPGAFFEGMKSLKVLDLTNTNVKEIPTSIRFLTNLRILHLKNCKSIIDISPIVELKKLEILSLVFSSIECLPEKLGQFTKLRLLDLRGCQSLETIPPNVISSLSQLEELCMAWSFVQWEVEEGTSNRSNASFAELKSLPRLTRLSIDIRDVECLSNHFSFPNLIRFDIFVGPSISTSFAARTEKPKSTNLYLKKIQMPSGDGIKVWLEKTKDLWLERIEGIKNILPDIKGLNGLKCLHILRDDEIECLVNATEWIPRVVFSNLEVLHLHSMDSLKEMCIGLLPSGSFSELRHLSVNSCDKLLNVVPSNLLPRLQNLTKLEVFWGSALEEVFNLEGIIEKGDDQLLSTLRALTLGYLPRLMHIWKGPSRLLCLHKLKEVEVDMCDTLRYIFSLSLTQSLLQLDVLRISNCNELEGIISKDKEEEVVAWKKGPRGFACFQHLRVVEVTHCNNLINLFSSFIARDLPEIAELTIGGCERMEVIVTKEMDGEEAVDKIVFPQLKKLELWDLSNLTCFCPGSFPFEWPSLEYLSVNHCFKMITFTAADTDAASSSTSAPGFQSTPKLKTIRVDEKYMLDGGDLNAIIQIYVKEKGGIEAISAGDFTLVKSTESATDQIMEALKDDNVNIIGLYGVGGVGKTTLVKQVGKRAKDEKLFDEVVMAVVSQHPDIKKIQEQIAYMLGLKFSETTDLGRADRLTERLANGKRILIIMDDVWARLDLVAVGIPFGNDHKGCKILLATRSQEVCNAMGSQTKKILLQALSEQESWALFKQNAGTCVNTPDINVVAMEVAKRCGGEETKACFLLCSLFPEDHQIEIEDLARYGMGQGLFQDVDTIEEGRGKAHTTIEHLKASCLLLDGFNNDFVRMYDVVRHVAKTIASKDKHVLVRAGEAGLKEWPNKGTFEHDTGISLMDNDIVELPHGLECPKLQILLLQNNINLKEISGAFFEGMKSLKVLDLTNTNVKEIPTSIRFLTNLRILHLKRCKSIIDISPIVELKKLEILSLAESSIECLPEEIGQLTKLRFLDLTACQSLKTIPPNVISSLTQLEELYMASSFAQWEVEEGTSNRSNVSFAELKSLPRLTSLSIDIRDVECLSKHFSFPNLIWFDIFVCSTLNIPFIRYVQPKSTKLCLEKIQMPSGDGIKDPVPSQGEQQDLAVTVFTQWNDPHDIATSDSSTLIDQPDSSIPHGDSHRSNTSYENLADISANFIEPPTSPEPPELPASPEPPEVPALPLPLALQSASPSPNSSTIDVLPALQPSPVPPFSLSEGVEGSVPTPVPSSNIGTTSLHPMNTRTRDDTRKSKVIFSLAATDEVIPSEPKTMKSALKHPGWILPLIENTDLVDHILGESNEPKPMIASSEGGEEANPNFLAWKREDRFLKSLITGTLSEEVLNLVVGLSTARETWSCLSKAFADASKDRELQLVRDLQSMKKGTNSVPEYLKNFKFVSDELAAIQKPVEEENKNLEGDGGSDSHAFWGQNKGKGNRFNNEKNWRQGQGRQGGNHKINSQGRGFTQTGQNRDNFVPRNNGGDKKQQPNKHQVPGNQNGALACQICGRFGHSALRCSNRYNHAYQAEDMPQALAAMNIDDPQDPEWIPDTGASSHMTNDPGIFTTLKPYQGDDKIIVGHGQALEISHVGSATIPIGSKKIMPDNVLLVPKIARNLLSDPVPSQGEQQDLAVTVFTQWNDPHDIATSDSSTLIDQPDSSVPHGDSHRSNTSYENLVDISANFIEPPTSPEPPELPASPEPPEVPALPLPLALQSASPSPNSSTIDVLPALQPSPVPPFSLSEGVEGSVPTPVPSSNIGTTSLHPMNTRTRDDTRKSKVIFSLAATDEVIPSEPKTMKNEILLRKPKQGQMNAYLADETKKNTATKKLHRGRRREAHRGHREAPQRGSREKDTEEEQPRQR